MCRYGISVYGAWHQLANNTYSKRSVIVQEVILSRGTVCYHNKTVYMFHQTIEILTFARCQLPKLPIADVVILHSTVDSFDSPCEVWDVSRNNEG